MSDFDLKAFDQTRDHANQMETADTRRNNMLDEMEYLYWMVWKEERIVTEQMQNIKVTRSPLARNSLIGAMRLLTAADPVISVPHDINNPRTVEVSSKVEKFCKAMLFASGRYSGDPLHYDAVRSALLYSEVVIGINSTKDLAKMSNVPAVKQRMEDLASRTPYLFEIWQPKACHSERDKFGMTSFYRKTDTSAGHVMDVYGQDGLDALMSMSGKKGKEPSRTDPVTLNIFYDLRDVCIWAQGCKLPIKQEEHGMPFIPVVDQIVEGSHLFDGNDNYHIQEPFLYTLDKTNLVERQNLMLTALYTMYFAIGANPLFVEYLINPDTPPDADYSEPGGVIRYRVNERREPMARQVIDPSFMQGWQISQDLEAQSTIYKQTLGEPLGTNAPYSMVALLSQSGRLPLIATQRKVGWAIAEALEIACKWLKADGRSATARYQTMVESIEPSDITSDIDINVQLEIETPMDKLQAANAANLLTQGDNPMVSQEWARENILNLGQSEDMTHKIWNEKAANVFFMKFLYEQLAQLAEAKQRAMMPGNAGGIPGAPAGQAPMPPPPQQAPMPEETPPPNFGTPPQPTGPNAPVENIPPLPPLEPSLSNQRPR